MDQDDGRDEAITEARVAGTSSRALAKQYGCTHREIEEAIDRRLSYELDNRQKLRLVKLSLGRIEALILPFFEKAVKDKDVAAGSRRGFAGKTRLGRVHPNLFFQQAYAFTSLRGRCAANLKND